MLYRIVGLIDPVLLVALIASGIWFVAFHPWGLDPSAAASLAGALFGGAAVLLGNWINRANSRYQIFREMEDRRVKLKALIGAELVNVAVGLTVAKKLMDAAIVSAMAQGPVPTQFDMTPYQPRAMPFTDSLGTELLFLEHQAIDALTTLRSNLAITQQEMDEITAGTPFGLLKATTLSHGLGHDMGILAETLEHIAPARKLTFPGKEPELATTILKRAAQPQSHLNDHQDN